MSLFTIMSPEEWAAIATAILGAIGGGGWKVHQARSRREERLSEWRGKVDAQLSHMDKAIGTQNVLLARTNKSLIGVVTRLDANGFALPDLTPVAPLIEVDDDEA